MIQIITKYRFFFIFVLLFLYCLLKAIHAQLGWLNQTEIIIAALITSSVLIIGHQEKLLVRVISLLIVTTIIFHLVALFFDSKIMQVFRLLLVIGFFTLMNYFCLLFTARDKTISVTTLFGSISAYFFMGLIFAYIYLLIELISPNSFLGLETSNEARAIYFSFITLTTVGYGDVTAVKPIAQTFTWFEAFSGQLYLAVIIGQLVGRYVAEHQRKEANN